MAYLAEMPSQCSKEGCRSKATVELRDWENYSRGRFCRPHGKKALKSRQEYEDTHNRDGSSTDPDQLPF